MFPGNHCDRLHWSNMVKYVPAPTHVRNSDGDSPFQRTKMPSRWSRPRTVRTRLNRGTTVLLPTPGDDDKADDKADDDEDERTEAEAAEAAEAAVVAPPWCAPCNCTRVFSTSKGCNRIVDTPPAMAPLANVPDADAAGTPTPPTPPPPPPPAPSLLGIASHTQQ